MYYIHKFGLSEMTKTTVGIQFLMVVLFTLMAQVSALLIGYSWWWRRRWSWF
jgi:hypothetical protein